jgi:hypothetical protein
MQKELTPYKCSKCGGNNSLEYGLCSGCLAESLCNPVDVAALLKRNDELLADLKTCWVPISRLLVVRLSSGETETLTLNRAKLILEKNPTIRSTKPALNSLIVHAGDWFAYWKAQDRAEEERVAGEFSEKLKKEASSKKPHPLR